MPPAGLIVAGTRSGCGKTTLALCLLAALRRRGLTVQACKAGPDFIDPTHHAALTGRPSYSIDTWMGGQDGARRVCERMLHNTPHAHMLLAEGVMGLFDGAQGMGGPGSTAHLARVLGLPVLLVADVRGMGQSAAALAAGFVRQQADLDFAGIVCTHVGSESHAGMLREAFAETFGEHGPPLLGLLPRQGVPELPSRHLGLVMAHEVAWDDALTAAMAHWCETHMDVEALLRQSGLMQKTQGPQGPDGESAHTLCPPWPSPEAVMASALPQAGADAGETASATPPRPIPACATAKQIPSPVCAATRIGIAHDAAFCFLYPDMPEVLREEGAETVFFSPLHDAALPSGCAALYFPGGYPELHAQKLSANTAMRDAVRAFAAAGGLVYGECGGYIYLMQSVEVAGHRHAMCGCLPLHCRLEASKAALGYREVRPTAQSPFSGAAACAGRGHEFHYARLVAPPTLPPLWQVRDRQGRALPDEGVVHGSVAASWVHLYPEGARALLHNLIQGLYHE